MGRPAKIFQVEFNAPAEREGSRSRITRSNEALSPLIDLNGAIQKLVEVAVRAHTAPLKQEISELRHQVARLSKVNGSTGENLTLKEAADRVRRHPNTIKKWIKQEKNPLTAEPVGRKWQIKQSDLDAYRPDSGADLDADRIARKIVASSFSKSVK